MESIKVNKVKNKCTMFTVSTSFLRYLVLLGLFLTSPVFAAAYCAVSGLESNLAFRGVDPQSGCRAYIANLQIGQPSRTFGYIGVTKSTTGGYACRFNDSPLATPFSESNSEAPMYCACDTLPVKRKLFITFSGPRSDPNAVPLTPPPLPNTCNQSCIENFSPSLTDIQAGGDGLGTGLPCLLMDSGNVSSCTLTFVPTGQSCFNLPITCTLPQIPNGNSQCETPACPVGQQRETSLGACKPVVCNSPMIKVGNLCKIPECETGSTYEYKDGAGSCVKNAPLCQTPLINVNNVCILPSCATGQVLDSASGVCKPNPDNNLGTGTGGTGTGGTGTGGTGTGGTGSGGTGSGGTGSGGTGSGGTGTGGIGTGGTGTGGTGSGTPSPNSGGGTNPGSGITNTGGDGLCKTPPCGKCDPAKETCGNTFGGSCKSNFQCNGDAIQCAVATATNKSECLQQSLLVDKDNDPAYAKGKAILDRVGDLGENDGYKKETVSISQVDTSNPYTSNCPSDAEFFSYKGTQFMIPWSKFCNIFQIMGSVMVLCSLLTAGLLLSKGNY